MTRSCRYQVPSAVRLRGEGDLGVMAVVLGHHAGVAQDRAEPGHDGRPPLEHGLAVLVGRGGVLGQERAEVVELLEVERPEVGVLQPAYGLELGRGVHGCTPFGLARAGPRPGYFPAGLGGWARREQHSGVPGDRKRQRIAAYGVCRDAEGRLLLARASPALTLQGRWFLPGGGVDHGESPADSLRREIEEESGLTVSVGPAARRPLRRAHDPRRHQPAHRAPHLPGGVLGRARCGPRSTAPPTPSGGSPPRRCGPCRWPTTSRSSWTGSCERDGRPTATERTMSSSSGRGFGGLFAARALKRRPVRVTLIDRTNHHLFQPLLYQVATGILSEGQIAPAIRDVLRNYPHLRVILGEVEHIDVEARLVHVDEFGKPLTIGYDSLIVAGGASTSYFGHDEFRERRRAA